MALVRKIFSLLFFVTFLLTGCDDFDDNSDALPGIKPFMKGETVSRTLLVYIVAENSISNDLLGDFNEIKNAAYDLPDDARLFVYFDNSDKTRLPALYQYHSYNNSLVENVVYTFDNDVCSSDTAVLGKVMNIIFTDYPTKAFDLVMGSHADGWISNSSKSSPNRSIGIDNGENTFSNDITTTIEIKELVELLQRLPVKIDRLMFDACLMQGVEVAYALRNVADWIIASPAEIPAYGAPYDKIIQKFFEPSSGVEDIMYEYKKAYDKENYAVLLSAVRTMYMQELADSTCRYVKKYFSVDTTINYNGSLAYVPWKAPAYYDICSVMKQVLDEVDYGHWKEALDKAVPYTMVSNSRKVWSVIANSMVTVRGDYIAVSAYFPQNKSLNYHFNNDFQTTEWYSVAGWHAAGW